MKIPWVLVGLLLVALVGTIYVEIAKPNLPPARLPYQTR